MKYKFLGEDTENSVDMLKKLIEAAQLTSEKLILIPLLEVNAPKTTQEKNEIINNIKKVLPEAEEKRIRLGFETEMDKDELLGFIEGFDSEYVGAYYDIGNGTSYGFDCPKDIIDLANKVFGVHAKDRKKHTTQSVILGTGDADYKTCFASLKKTGFKEVVVMQAWRGEKYLEDAKVQYLFLKNILS